MLTVCQLVLDIAGDLLQRAAIASRTTRRPSATSPGSARFAPELVRQLEPLPGIRNVLVHDCVGLDLDRVIEALDSLALVEAFFAVVHTIASRPS